VVSLTQGARAVENGRLIEKMIESHLCALGYLPNRYGHSVDALVRAHKTLTPVAGQFICQCTAPLIAPYHRGHGRTARVDFGILTCRHDVVLVSIKSQQSDGTAEEKLEFEVQQLIATELPAAMLVYGPLRGRDGPTGWSPDVLGPIWERALYLGGNRVLLFRDTPKFIRWAEAGFPVPGRGVTSAAIFAEFCDREI
jgi:hypothetical protein